MHWHRGGDCDSSFSTRNPVWITVTRVGTKQNPLCSRNFQRALQKKVKCAHTEVTVDMLLKAEPFSWGLHFKRNRVLGKYHSLSLWCHCPGSLKVGDFSLESRKKESVSFWSVAWLCLVCFNKAVVAFFISQQQWRLRAGEGNDHIQPRRQEERDLVKRNVIRTKGEDSSELKQKNWTDFCKCS